MTPAIEAQNLVKSFGGRVRALDGVSFSVRILTTILQPDSGSARVLGHDVVTEGAKVRTLIGLAGQYAAVDENLTGRENIFMVGRLNHLPRDVVARRATELLAQFGLAEAGDRTLKTYSGGMRRRLDLAAALVARPAVLFLDEPTTGLDLRSRNDLWEMIEALVDGGTTVLLTTQYLEEADRLARRVAVVDHGRAIAEGTPDQLKADLGATVLDVGLPDAASAARAAEILANVGAKPPSIDGSSIELPVDDGPRAAMEALRLLDAHHVAPTTFVLREPSLDDVFLALTGKRTEATDEDADSPDGDPSRARGRRRAASKTGGVR
jgi:ABC-type multidrug transport system ATPase subunit